MCVTFVTCEVRVCGPRCHSGSSLYIYRVYSYPPPRGATARTRHRKRVPRASPRETHTIYFIVFRGKSKGKRPNSTALQLLLARATHTPSSAARRAGPSSPPLRATGEGL